MHAKQVIYKGAKPAKEGKAIIMLHGRGSNAEDILGLAPHLNTDGFTLAAPQATNNTWYPYSFLAPPTQNQPWLDSAISLVDSTVQELLAAGIDAKDLYFTGFSQGACLTLEYIARNPGNYGGVAAFTGGLIGDRIYDQHYKKGLDGTPVFIGTSDPDPHVPVERVLASAELLTGLGASVTHKVYENMGHTIISDEIAMANKILFNYP